jgi:hypothetical protein
MHTGAAFTRAAEPSFAIMRGSDGSYGQDSRYPPPQPPQAQQFSQPQQHSSMSASNSLAPGPVRRELPPLGALRAPSPLTQSRLRPLSTGESPQHGAQQAPPGLGPGRWRGESAGGSPAMQPSSSLGPSRLRPLDTGRDEDISGPTTRLDFGREQVRPPPMYGGEPQQPLPYAQPAYAQPAMQSSDSYARGAPAGQPYDDSRGYANSRSQQDDPSNQQYDPNQRARQDYPSSQQDYRSSGSMQAASNEVGRMSQDGDLRYSQQQQMQPQQLQPPSQYGQDPPRSYVQPLPSMQGTPQQRPFDPNDPRNSQQQVQQPQQYDPRDPRYQSQLQPTQPLQMSQSYRDTRDGYTSNPSPALTVTDPNGLASPSNLIGSPTPVGGSLQLPSQRLSRFPGSGPLTPQRAAFSPHASKSAAPPKTEEMPASPDRRTGAAQPMMKDLEELLSPPGLQIYLPFFLRLRQPPLTLETVLDLDDAHTDDLLDEVEALAEDQGGVHMKGSHKHHILTRIKQERIKRESERRRAAAAASPLASSGKNQFGTMSPTNLQSPTGAYIPPGEQATTNIVFRDGFRGLIKHWCCCAGLCVLMIVLATIFLLLYQHVGLDATDSSGSGSNTGVNGSSVSSTSAGGWKFVYILAILGFIFAGVAFFTAVFSWFRNPQHRSCSCAQMFSPECKNLSCKNCCSTDVCRGCCTMPECDCCDSMGCGDCTTGLKAGCSSCYASVREECHLPECPELECGDCCACHSCRDCIHECGCNDCCSCDGPSGCDDCCKDCAMPACDCNCCPDCEGDINSCCATLYKICCCQCKIQVS